MIAGNPKVGQQSGNGAKDARCDGELTMNPRWCAPAFSTNTKWALKDTRESRTQTAKHFLSLSPSPCVEKARLLLLLLSRNTDWVLTQIPKYLRAAFLSCFAVKWLPLHQWNNNWCDNRFIWTSSSIQCHFVEWKQWQLADTFGFGVWACLEVCICWETKLQ